MTSTRTSPFISTSNANNSVLILVSCCVILTDICNNFHNCTRGLFDEVCVALAVTTGGKATERISVAGGAGGSRARVEKISERSGVDLALVIPVDILFGKGYVVGNVAYYYPGSTDGIH
jgi:hypothetical protein